VQKNVDNISKRAAFISNLEKIIDSLKIISNCDPLDQKDKPKTTIWDRRSAMLREKQNQILSYKQKYENLELVFSEKQQEIATKVIF
jgi:Asp-tRNA(Asn)/Glu-tRNA(Gln) amidotransferase C subunit